MIRLQVWKVRVDRNAIKPLGQMGTNVMNHGSVIQQQNKKVHFFTQHFLKIKTLLYISMKMRKGFFYSIFFFQTGSSHRRD